MRAYNDRLDPFTDTMNSVAVTGELHRIPTVGDPVIKLREVPLKTDPSTLTMRVRDLLTAAVASTEATTIYVANYAWYVSGDVITIDSEKMQVSATPSTSAVSVTRAYGGTTATTHTIDTPVYIEGSMDEVNAAPSVGQFYPDYATGADNDENYNGGQILFHSSDAGKIVAVNYDKTGAQADDRVVRVSLPNHIIKGLTIEVGEDLVPIIKAGRAWIDNELVELTEDFPLTVQARRAALAYIGTDGIPAKISAAFPAADAGTVCRWIIDGNATIASTVGSNNLTKNGTVASVPGWAADNAGSFVGGTVGNYSSANTTNFPNPANSTPLEIDVIYTHRQNPDTNTYLTINTQSVYSIYIGTDGQLAILNDSGAVLWTGYFLAQGKTYYIARLYDGTDKVYVDGQCIYQSARSRSGAPGATFSIGNAASTGYTNGVVHYIEVRNSVRTPTQIAAISNALLLPCRYTGEAFIPIMTSNTAPSGVASASAEYSSTYAAWKAMDANESTYWQPSASGSTGYLQYQSPVGTIDDSYIVKGGSGYYPTAWEYLVSNDGLTWKILDIKTGQKTDVARTYRLNNTSTYTYRRLNITASAGAGLRVVTFQINSVSSDIRSILPANTHPLGFAWTDADSIIEKDDHSHKYGRRERITGGNRIEKLGWQYYSGAADLEWPNPFDTRELRLTAYYADDTAGTNRSQIQNDVATGYFNPTPSQPIRYSVTSSGVTVNGAAKTSGYIEVVAEVLDNVV